MHIVNVLPIVKSSMSGTLTYFSAKEVVPGSLVVVPLRKKSVYGIATEVKDATEMRSGLRSAHFNLRKIEKVIGLSPLHPSLVKTAEMLEDYYATSAASILESMIPEVVLSSLPKLSPSFIKKEELENTIRTKTPITIFQAPEDERISFWKTHIREIFAQKKHVLFIVPTIRLVKKYEKLFERGIRDYVVTYSSETRPKEVLKMWEHIRGENHPLLLIGTPHALSFFDDSFGSIIIEREHHFGYMMRERPFIDVRDIALSIAKESNCPIILADTLLRTETMHEYEQKNYSSIRVPSFRFPELTMAKIETLAKENEPWRLLSKTLEKAIGKVAEKNEHLIIFTTRKGLAPITQCGDCKQVLPCSACSAPLVLYKKGAGRQYVCNRCGNEETADRVCPHCESWNLVGLGVGTEAVLEQLQNGFPDTQVFVLDKALVKNAHQAEEIVNAFEKNKSGILITTEYGLPYLEGPYDKVAIASIDTLFAIPHFRMNENILIRILELAHLSLSPLLIQTSNQEESLLDIVSLGHLGNWHKEEIADRELLRYPPYGTIIAIYSKGALDTIKKHKTVLEKEFEKYSPYLSLKIINKEKKQGMLTMVIKVPRNEWPKKDGTSGKTPLSTMIETLPPDMAVMVNPDSIVW